VRIVCRERDCVGVIVTVWQAERRCCAVTQPCDLRCRRLQLCGDEASPQQGLSACAGRSAIAFGGGLQPQRYLTAKHVLTNLCDWFSLFKLRTYSNFVTKAESEIEKIPNQTPA
jgi:hypothetical protein